MMKRFFLYQGRAATKVRQLRCHGLPVLIQVALGVSLWRLMRPVVRMRCTPPIGVLRGEVRTGLTGGVLRGALGIPRTVGDVLPVVGVGRCAHGVPLGV